MIAGALEIQLLANMAQLTRDMGAAKRLVGDTVGSIERLAGQASRALGAIGAGLSLTGLVALGKGAIDATDKLNDLSKSTGLAVETLAGIRVAARQSGGELEGIAAAINKLSQNIGKDTEKFRLLGISARDPLEAFKQLADIFVAVEDPQTRAALGAEALGKSWASAAPLLAEGGQRIGELVARGSAAAGVTSEMARAADEFNDKLVLLVSTGGTVNAVIGPMLPLLNKLLDDLLALQEASKGASVGFNPFVEALRALIILGGNIGFVFRGMAIEIGGVAAQVTAFLSGDFKGAAEIGRQMKADAEAARASFDAWEQSVLAVGTAATAATPSLKGMGEAGKKAADEAAARIKAFLDAERIKKQAEEAARALQRARFESAQAWLAGEEESERMRAEAHRIYNEGIIAEDKRAAEERIKIAALIAEAEEEFEREKAEAQRLGAQFILNEDRKRLAEAQRDWGGFVGGIESAFRDGWDRIGDSWQSALDVMKSALKRTLLDFIYQSLAKPLVLNLLVSLGNTVGAGGLATAATAAGGGAMNLGNILSIGSSLLPSGAVGTAFSNVAQMGAGALGLSGSLGSTIGSFASFLPGIGSLIAIGSILYSLFKGGPENPEFRLLQGTGGAGAFGGISTQGNFAMGAQWEQLLAYVGNLDARFSRLLGAEGSSAASARLAAYTGMGLRSDGQPATFGIPPGSEREGAEQIARELLQSRYGILFEGIDKGIAEQIRAWSGTSTELQAFIEQMLGIIEGLSGSGIKGLDITALRAMQREGEDLGQTFQRVGSQWAQFNDLFTTDAERLAAARELIAKTFGDLGLAVPASAQAFENLVRGLDLSTEAGRKMFEALLEVAPAFASVSRAAEEAWAEVQGLVGRITGTTPGGGFAGAVSAFQAGNAWAAGLSGAALVQQLLTITEQDFQNYSEANQALIKQILALYEGMGDLSTAASAAAGGLASIGEMVPGNQYGTKMGIQNYLMSLLTGEQASPLTLAQRTQIAGSDFQRLLARAQAGDWSAMEQLQGSAQTYLGLAREQFASSPAYNAIFQQVFTALQGVSGFHLDWQGQLVNAGAATNEKLDQLNDQLGSLLGLIASGQQTGDTAVAQAVRDSAREIVEELRAGEPGLVT